MADYENLLDSIDAVIKSNNRREITGQILQNTLHQMVGSLGENYQLAGFATPTLDPNSPDQNVFYITDEAGVYTNFDNITLGAGLSFLMWKNEEWTSKTLDIVTADWVDEHYVSKAFLRKVFQFFDEDGVEIFPNDTESVVDNIKAMCGLWTNEYLSALGLGEGSTIPTTLAALNDVTITNPQDGQALVYDAASLHWVNATIQSGVDMSVVWAALAGATNEQINISHLTTALNDYVTATSLATTLQSYVTTSALATELANYASQSWVETNYISKAFFNSLFQAQDVNGNAITPNNSGQTTIDRLKILVGAYTEQYLSALGLSSGGGGGGSSTLAGLNDVTITYPLLDGQALIYDEQSGHWVNGAAISMSAVWTALAAATSEQINSSHLTSALSGYVTTSALASELANYVTTSSLATTLADYVTTSALATTLADYGSKTWIDNNYVSKAFFNRLFQAFAPLSEGQTEPTQVEPNDTTTTIDNIKAMFGLWTEQYLSALGLSAGGGGGYTLNEPLASINSAALGTPSQANVSIVWNGTAWTYGTTMSSVSWNDVTNKPTTLAGYGITDAYISNGTITLGSNSITPITSLSGYATENWVQQQGYITGITSSMVTSALGYTPANSSSLSNYLPLSGGTLTGSITFNFSSSYQTTYNEITNWEGGLFLNGRNNTVSIGKMGVNAIMLNTSNVTNTHIVYFQNADGTIALTSDIPSLSGYATQTWVGQNYLALSGGTLSGSLTSKNITGGDESNRLTFRHLDGQNCNGDYNLYLQYYNRGENSTKVYFAGSTYYIDGGYYNGSCAYATSAGTATDSTKLPLTGGTLTGELFVETTTTTGWVSQFLNSGGNIGVLLGVRTIAAIGTYGAANLAINPDGGNVGIGTTSPAMKLTVNGQSLIEGECHLCANGIGFNRNVTNGAIFNASKNGGQVCYSSYYDGIEFGTVTGAGSYRFAMLIRLNGNVGINIATPSYRLHVDGDIYATGGVTAASDERLKDVYDNISLSVEQIANAPAVRFYWKADHSKGLQAGTLAQYWQSVLPEVVSDRNNELGMQYGVTALVSVVGVAREVLSQKEEIEMLKNKVNELGKENEYLREEINRLKVA